MFIFALLLLRTIRGVLPWVQAATCAHTVPCLPHVLEARKHISFGEVAPHDRANLQQMHMAQKTCIIMAMAPLHHHGHGTSTASTTTTTQEAHLAATATCTAWHTCGTASRSAFEVVVQTPIRHCSSRNTVIENCRVR